MTKKTIGSAAAKAFGQRTKSKPKFRNFKSLKIWVEGETEYLFFRHFLYSSVSVEPRNGKEQVIKAIKALIRQSERKNEDIISHCTFGIVDRDIDNFLGDEYNLENLFISDDDRFYRFCIENMNATRFFEFFLNDTAERNYLDRSDSILLKAKIIEIAARIGRYFIMNQSKPLGLKFQGLDFSNFISFEDSLRFDETAFLNTLVNNSQTYVDVEEMKEELRFYSYPSTETIELCKGHDLVEILIIIIRKIGRNRRYRRYSHQELIDEIEKQFRLIFDESDFYELSPIQYISNVCEREDNPCKMEKT